MPRLAPIAALLLAGACTKYPYVALLDGDWAGTANEQAGGVFNVLATFDYDEEEEDYPLTGFADIDGYVFDLYSAESDKQSATIEMLNPLGVRFVTFSEVTVAEEKMLGSFEINQCYATDPAGAGPGCKLIGEFDLDLE